ncbi:thymidine phosphorylase [Jannaschia seohaensis]|uniref:Thymidine phosphorylase n=1 Tax=Jannaschia seohaensis TaxID=475081 RepID=A0A2Y9AGA7_9RHOB|nr:thymidine phosphorylase [Jannaschia seohaensis]PWJ21179.1 thymidine phosphorylase [Jannaschia seohaensis]SSA41589.1 thymidine phosphorylase [Jannaschia seohaensis]
MSARDTLLQLRRGEAPGARALTEFAEGLADGSVSDAQAGAFAMGVCHTPLAPPDRAALTRAMRDGGEVLHWDLDGPVVDKHSTGGVGDCVSLVLAPALAACGAYVPMISGRGLGHTGGTLDKLAAIPGFRTEMQVDELQSVVARVGCAIVGASADIAPADRRLYAVRDVTGTVESLDLIVASILSKKLAEGPEALVLDVKTGSGAFMTEETAARALAAALVETAQANGVMTSAVLTDMSQPAATSAGNALEVISAMEALTEPGARDALRLVTLTQVLGGELLALGGLAQDAEDGAERISRALASGEAAEVFGRMVKAQGGPGDFPERWRDRLPAAPVVAELRADRPGVVARIDTRALGETVVELGGGRLREDDRIDPTVGISHIVSLGSVVGEGQPLARVHAADGESAERAAARVAAAIGFAPGAVTPPPLIRETLR